MPVIVCLPAYLQPFAGGRTEIDVPVRRGATVAEALEALREPFPGVHARIVTERGEVREHVNVFIGSERIRDGAGLASPLADGAELIILPAISGG